MPSMTLAAARRTAIAAQGLAGPPAQPRPDAVNLGHFQRLIDRLGLIQIDSVNVVARAHLLPVFSRLGDYDTGLFDRATRGTAARPRRLMECVAHEAAFVPPVTYQRLRWRVPRRVQQWHDRLWSEHPEVVDAVRTIVAQRGPITARQVHAELGHDRPAGENWGWNWTLAKEVLEAGFRTSEFASAYRTAQFERAYDLTERVLPRDLSRAEPPQREQAIVDLVDIAARAHGVGTIACLADYFRLPIADTAAAIGQLVTAGQLEEVAVRDWTGPTYRHVEAHTPRRVTGRALLAPFDPLVFERDRLEALFAMRYRIEIYTPAAKRVYGYYVLPFLLGEHVVARVDVKADRASGVLVVRSAFAQPDAPSHTATELAAELRDLAHWLGVTAVTVADDGRGDLIDVLRRTI